MRDAATDTLPPLKPRQLAFADAYLLCSNATEAARQVGYSEKTARQIGAENLSKPAIAQYIRLRTAERQEKERPLQEKVLRELETMALFNAEDLVTLDEDGNARLDFRKAKRHHYAAITSLQTKKRTTRSKDGEVNEDVQFKVGLADKYRGLELLGRHLGMFKEAEQRVVVDVADRLLQARSRLRTLDNETGEEILGD